MKGGHFKSCNEVRKMTEKIAGVSIPYFFQVDYGAVKDIVDLFGGVKVNVTKRMRYTDKADGLYIDFKPGAQILKGQDAVKYLRFRSDPTADLGRIDRQQKFVVSFLEKAKAKMSVEKLPKLYGIIKKDVNTNVPLRDVINLYKAYKDFRIAEAKRYTLPGEPARIRGISYWKPDVLQGRKLLRK